MYKKSLKIPKGYTELVNRRRSDNNNRQKKKDKKTNNDLQNITQKTKDRTTRTLLKTGGELNMSSKIIIHISDN